MKKVPLGAINRNDPPIAGLNSVSVADGLTTQYVYFRGITNEQEVEYSKTVNLLGGGTEDVSIDAALAKLYSSIASGGVNWEFGDSSCGSATVVIAPDEKTMQVSISDAVGRTVMQATMTGPTATTPNQLVNWSCTRHDDIDTATNAIHTLKTSQIDPDGKVVATFTDGLGRTIAVVDQLGKKSTSQFDSGGNLLKSINALSKETVYTYDGLGRQLTVKDPLNNTQTTVYDPDTGQITQRKDAKNVSTYFAYDDLGRNTTTTDRLGKVTTRTYDGAGRLGTIVDAQSKTTTYGYDLLGQRISVALPDTSSKTFEFDAAGRVTKVTLESGITQKTIYEFSGVIDKIEYRDDSNTLTGTDDFTYNALLQRTAATSRYGVVSGWTYDDLGRTLNESTTYSGKIYTVGYDYDSRGRLEEITYPSGRKAEYTFDERGAIDLIKWDSAQIENRGYDDLGRLTSVDRPGVDETRAYDDAGRLTSIGNTNVGTATYTYDANHNKLSESWSGAMAAWSFTTENGGTYPSGYDAEDRFRNFIQSGQSKSLYLDRSDIGNITNYQMNSNNSYRTYNNVHGLTSVGGTGQVFDDDGNLTASYHGHTLSWDEAGMLKQVVVPSSPTTGIEGTNEFGYDAFMRRTFKKITRSSTIAEHVVSIYAGPNLIAEYDAGTVAGSPNQEYVYAQEIDSLILLVRSGGSQKLTITRNQQWSVTALADLSTGTVLERYTYDALGKRTILAADGSTVRNTSSYNMPFGYTSRQHDPETGLIHFLARYYDPSTGEFLSRDRIEYVDGMSQYRGYFVPSKIDYLGEFAVSPMRLPRQEPDFTIDDLSSEVTSRYCDAANKHRKNGWLRCACNVSINIDRAIYTLDWWAYFGNSTAEDKSKWFKCTRTCLQQKWREAVDMQEDNADLPADSGWNDWCKKCTLNSDSIECCKEQVKAEQTELQKCFAGCGRWQHGNTFPVNRSGFEGDFNDLQKRIQFGNSECCNRQYYPNPPDVKWPPEPPRGYPWYDGRGGPLIICFKGGTLVQLENQSQKIEDVEVGDLVWSYCVVERQWSLKAVEAIEESDFVGTLFSIEFDGNEVIESTDTHPYWVETYSAANRPLPANRKAAIENIQLSSRWVQAKDIKVGDQMLVLNGETKGVKAIHSRKVKIKVYNLRVEGNRNYAVGNDGILVHNT